LPEAAIANSSVRISGTGTVPRKPGDELVPSTLNGILEQAGGRMKPERAETLSFHRGHRTRAEELSAGASHPFDEE
jgi:hypothetical protein